MKTKKQNRVYFPLVDCKRFYWIDQSIFRYVRHGKDQTDCYYEGAINASCLPVSERCAWPAWTLPSVQTDWSVFDLQFFLRPQGEKKLGWENAYKKRSLLTFWRACQAVRRLHCRLSFFFIKLSLPCRKFLLLGQCPRGISAKVEE